MHRPRPIEITGVAVKPRKPRFARDDPPQPAAPAPEPVAFDGDLGPVQSGPLSRMRQSMVELGSAA